VRFDRATRFTRCGDSRWRGHGESRAWSLPSFFSAGGEVTGGGGGLRRCLSRVLRTGGRAADVASRRYVGTRSGTQISVEINGALVTPGGGAWPVGAMPASARFAGEAVEGEWLVRDLDGDGRDERFQIAGTQRDGWSVSTLTVFAVADHTLVAGSGLRVSNSYSGPHGEALRCTSTHRFLDGPHHTTLIEIVAPTTAGGTDCPAPGRHRYRWERDKASRVLTLRVLLHARHDVGEGAARSVEDAGIARRRDRAR
jgi:hypothetical protein